MKKNILFSILFLFFSISIYAESSGSASIAPFTIHNDYISRTLYLKISNISDVETSVVFSVITGCDSNNDAIFLVDSDGVQNRGLFIGGGDFVSYNESSSTGSLDFTIKPYSTVSISVNPPYQEIYTGYGIIEWNNDSNDPCSLVATCSVLGGGEYLYINGGNAF